MGPVNSDGPAQGWRTHWASDTDLDPRLLLRLDVGAVTVVAWQADGPRPLLAGCLREEGPAGGEPRFRLRVWDVLSGVSTDLPGTGWVQCLEFTTIDGEPVLVTAHHGVGLRIWNVAQARLVATVPIGGHEVTDLHLAEIDGEVRAFIRDGLQVHVWSLPSGESRGMLAAPEVYAMTASRSVLVTAGAGVSRWELGSGARVSVRVPAGVPPERGRLSTVLLATVDGRDRVTVGDPSNEFVTFDPATGELLGRPLTAHVNRFGDVLMPLGRDGSERKKSIAAVGGVLAIATAGRVHLWDSGTAEPHALPLTGPVARPMLLTVRWQDREVLLTASQDDGVVALWDLDRPVTRPPGHDQRITRVAVAAPADVVVSVDVAGILVARDAADGRLVAPPLATGVQSTAALVAWPAGSEIIAATGAGTRRFSDGHLRRWSVTTGSPAGPPIKAHNGFVHWLARVTLSSREVLATSGPTTGLRLWDPATGALIGETETGIRSKQTGFAVGDLNGRPYAAISSYSQPLSLYALDDLTAPPILIPDAGNDHVLALARDHLVTAHFDRKGLRTWHVPGRPAGPDLSGAAEITDVAVRDWPVFYIGRSDGTVALTDVLTGADLGPPLTLPLRPVSLAVLGGGDLVVGYGSDTARVSPPVR